jgi:hypothetical protein
MKENGSSTSKMINRNWVLKRKRRKLPCGPVLSNGKEEDSSVVSESPMNTSSAKRRLKSEINSERCSSKKKGNDGVSYLLCFLAFPPIYFGRHHHHFFIFYFIHGSFSFS